MWKLSIQESLQCNTRSSYGTSLRWIENYDQLRPSRETRRTVESRGYSFRKSLGSQIEQLARSRRDVFTTGDTNTKAKIRPRRECVKPYCLSSDFPPSLNWSELGLNPIPDLLRFAETRGAYRRPLHITRIELKAFGKFYRQLQ